METLQLADFIVEINGMRLFAYNPKLDKILLECFPDLFFYIDNCKEYFVFKTKYGKVLLTNQCVFILKENSIDLLTTEIKSRLKNGKED